MLGLLVSLVDHSVVGNGVVGNSVVGSMVDHWGSMVNSMVGHRGVVDSMVSHSGSMDSMASMAAEGCEGSELGVGIGVTCHQRDKGHKTEGLQGIDP